MYQICYCRHSYHSNLRVTNIIGLTNRCDGDFPGFTCPLHPRLRQRGRLGACYSPLAACRKVLHTQYTLLISSALHNETECTLPQQSASTPPCAALRGSNVCLPRAFYCIRCHPRPTICSIIHIVNAHAVPLSLSNSLCMDVCPVKSRRDLHG